MGFWKSADRTETAISLAERAMAVIDYLGLKQPLRAALWTTILLATAWISRMWDHFPYSLVICISLFAAACAARLYIAIKAALAIRGIKKLDLAELGAACTQFYRDFSDFVTSQSYSSLGAIHEGTPREQWERRTAHTTRVNGLMMQRFGTRAFSLAHQIQSVGIPAPGMFHFSAYDAGGAAVYIGVVGELLSKGLLEEAKKLDPKLTWGATIYTAIM